jgi:hypothetical protein
LDLKAAKNLGVCTTKLKQISRKNGISRWPYRKLTAIENKLQKIQEAYSNDPNSPGLQLEMEALRKQKKMIFERTNSFTVFPVEDPLKPKMMTKMSEPKPSFLSKMNLANNWVRCPEAQELEIRRTPPMISSPPGYVLQQGAGRSTSHSSPFQPHLGFSKFGVEWSQSFPTQQPSPSSLSMFQTTSASGDQAPSVVSPSPQTMAIQSSSFLSRPPTFSALETSTDSSLLSSDCSGTDETTSTTESLTSIRSKIFLQNNLNLTSGNIGIPASPNSASMTSSSFLRAFNSFTFDSPSPLDSSNFTSSSQTLAHTQSCSTANSDPLPDSSPFPCKRHHREFKAESPLFHKRFHQTQSTQIPTCSLFSLEVDDFLGLEEPNNTLSSFDLEAILHSNEDEEKVGGVNEDF